MSHSKECRRFIAQQNRERLELIEKHRKAQMRDIIILAVFGVAIVCGLLWVAITGAV